MSLARIANEKAAQVDKGSIMEFPVSMHLWMGVMCALCGWWALGLLSSENTLAQVLGSFLVFSFIGVIEFPIAAIYKWQRDLFWRALDTINALDLRRTPAVSF